MPWSFGLKKKCPVCNSKFSSSEPFHEMRLNTSDGLHTLDICESCADFFDKSAEVIAKGRTDEAL